MRFHMCGTPSHECSGAKRIVPWPGDVRAHEDPAAAFKCHKSYLIRLGFTEVGRRELVNPETGAIRVLTKPSRFGAPLRQGKRGGEGDTASLGKSTRSVFFRTYGGCSGGIGSY